MTRGRGALVGAYRLGTRLGGDGVGELWLAYDTRREREVALKLLTNRPASGREFRVRFVREARVTARLESVHVIPVHDFGEIDGCPFLDMRLVPANLAAVLRGAPGGLAPRRAVELLVQLADALDTAHAAGLLHCDVKPANVLVARHHGEDFCYLTDFGIRKNLHDTCARTGTSVALGTRDYPAPELFTTGRADVRSDVYALGCLCFEMLCGHPPFTARTPVEVLDRHLHAPVPRLAAHHPELAALDPVLAAALAKDPAARFASAGALAGAAVAALRVPPPTRRLPLPAPPDTTPLRRPAGWLRTGRGRRRSGGRW